MATLRQTSCSYCCYLSDCTCEDTSFSLSFVIMRAEHAVYTHLLGEFFVLQIKNTMTTMIRMMRTAPISPPITPPATAPADAPAGLEEPVVVGGCV